MNPFFAMRDQLLELPEEKRRLLARGVWGVTSDTRRRCGCLFGTLQPLPRGGIAALGEGDGEMSIHGRLRQEPAFRAWAYKLGFPEESTQEELRNLEMTNDELTRSLYTPTVDNTEAACRARFDRMVGELTRRGEEWEKQYVQG